LRTVLKIDAIYWLVNTLKSIDIAEDKSTAKDRENGRYLEEIKFSFDKEKPLFSE